MGTDARMGLGTPYVGGLLLVPVVGAGIMAWGAQDWLQASDQANEEAWRTLAQHDVRVLDAMAFLEGGRIVELSLRIRTGGIAENVSFEDAVAVLRSPQGSSTRAFTDACPEFECLSALRDADDSVPLGILNGSDLVDLRMDIEEADVPIRSGETLWVDLYFAAGNSAEFLLKLPYATASKGWAELDILRGM